MVSVTGALRSCMSPCSSIRSFPRCSHERNQSTTTALWNQVLGGEATVTRAKWNQNFPSSSISSALGDKPGLVLSTSSANFRARLPRTIYSSNLCSKAVRVGSTTSPTDVEVGTGTSVEQEAKSEDRDSPPTWTIKMLYDGDCPLCMREVDMLRGRNKTYGTIKFVDISSDSYSAEENSGIDFEEAMGRIHAILRDGTILTNVAAFKRLYEEVGLGWVYAVTNFEPVGRLADSVYSFWAKYRLPLTGRPPLIEVLEARRSKKAESCDIGGCRVD